MKLKRLSMVFAMCVLFAAFATISASAADFAGGSGTKADPYLISETTHLNNVRKDLDAYYQMVDDVTFEEEDFAQDGDFYNKGAGWKPIGSTAAPFTGTFDGDGYTITGLYQNISASSDAYAGLFGCAKDAKIESLNLKDSDLSVTRTGTGNTYMGGLVAYIDGTTTIQDCSSAGDLSVSGQDEKDWDTFAGGIVGYSGNYCNGSISGCKNESTITSAVSGRSTPYINALGGIIGRVSSTDFTIEGCCNLGSVTGPTSEGDLGGIAGTLYGKIQRCYNAGTVNGWYAGGIAGYAYSATIQDCYNCGTLQSYSFGGTRGGIAGVVVFALPS